MSRASGRSICYPPPEDPARETEPWSVDVSDVEGFQAFVQSEEAAKADDGVQDASFRLLVEMQ
jgi:hypothetical protein